MSNNITLEKAVSADAADMAILDNIASHGLSLWYWQKAVERGEAVDAYEWGRQRMGEKNSPFGYINAVLAKVDGKIAGVAVGNLMKPNDAVPEKSLDPVVKPIYDLISLCHGDWLLDNLAVYYTMQKRGIGAKLLDDCFKRAKREGAAKLSLVAEDNNETALALYASRGLVERDRQSFVPFHKDNKTRYWVLMSAPVN